MKRLLAALFAIGLAASSAFAQGTFQGQIPADNVVGNFSASASPLPSYLQLPNCTGGLTYSTTTHTAGCNTSSASGRTPVADVNYTVVSTDILVSYTSLTASRSVQLPAASTFVAGRILYLEDASGSAGLPTLAIAPNGTDTIDGVNSAQSVINTPFGRVQIISDGATKWIVAKTAIVGDVVAADFGGKALVATIQPNVVSNAKFRQSAALSLVGNCSNATANAGDVIGTTDQVMRVSSAGTSCAWGQVNLSSASAVVNNLPLGNGGTNAALTASNGGLVFSTGSAFSILAGTATAGQIPRSGASAVGSWSTATYPATTAAGNILASGSANTITGTSTPTLGAAGTQGTLALAGLTSGSVTQTTQSTAGTPTITWGNTSGTPAVTATGPLAIATATGNATCTTCATTTSGGALSGTAPVALSAGGAISITGAAGQLLAGAGPAFTAAPTLGVNTSVTGSLGLANGGASGATVTVQNPSTTAAYNFNLPTSAGTAGQPLLSGGGVGAAQTYGTLGVPAGGTSITSGTSGGLPFFNSTTTMASSALLTANQIMLGGGAGVAPSTLGSLGTTTTVLHGNAAGAPTFGAVSLTADVSNTLPVNNGGTNGTTPASARGGAGLNIDQLTGHGDSIYTILSTDRTVATNAAFTASRTWTLPAANAINPGQQLLVADFQGTVTATNTLVITRAGADTVNGGTSVTINSANGAYLLWSDGVSKWTAQQIGGGSVSGVSSLGGLTGAISVSGGIAASGSSIVNVGVHEPCGRLTISTGNPVMTATVTGATSHFFSPYNGCQFVPIFNGTIFVLTDTAGELTQTTADTTKSPAAVTTNSNYDVFVWNDAGTIRATRGPTWNAGAVVGSDVARGTGAGSTELQRLNGIWTNKNAITNGPAANRGTYVGTFRSNGTSTIDYQFGTNISGGGAALLYVWNAYNRVSMGTEVADGLGSWTQTGATVGNCTGAVISPLDCSGTGAGLNNRISILSGLAEDDIYVSFVQRFTMAAVATAVATAGFAMDSTTVYDRRALVQNPVATGFGLTQTMTKPYPKQLGLHFFQALQASDGTNTATWNGGGTATDSALEIVWRN